MPLIRSRPNRRGAALYISVMSTALIVSLLGLAGLNIVRIERAQMSAGADRETARTNANSAVELALRVVANNANWRTTYSSGVETPLQSPGPNAKGSLSWILEDADGNLNNADVDLKLKGVGRVGDSVQVSTISLAGSETPVGPTELRSYNPLLTLSAGQVVNNKWWCQYLKPNLPVNATRWWVTSVEIHCVRAQNNKIFYVRLYEPLPSNWPGVTMLDEVELNSNSVGILLASFHTFNLNGDYALSPDQGICLALETTSTEAAISVSFQGSGVSEDDSAMIEGNPVWNSYSPSKSLRYRIHGTYQVPSSAVNPVTGSWVWDSAP